MDISPSSSIRGPFFKFDAFSIVPLTALLRGLPFLLISDGAKDGWKYSFNVEDGVEEAGNGIRTNENTLPRTTRRTRLRRRTNSQGLYARSCRGSLSTYACAGQILPNRRQFEQCRSRLESFAKFWYTQWERNFKRAACWFRLC